ncbi:MAG TPA: serine/threonine-protein kinase [Solirubrobacteraceae bacterium]|nr:serine/threonine-protein kinase [Solirubrobacteraceae bacterium]
MTTATLLRPGDTLGGFRIDDVIGIGGMAIVYRAEQISLGRAVALKVLSSKLTNDAVFRERFRREGTHAATLEHPNIVPVYDSGEQDGHLYLAMRLVDGTNLAELLHTRGLTAHQTIELLQPIASALDTAHAAGLIHRDVKPQNILITAQGHPYLADFGVAKGSNTDGLTATGSFVGSINYAPPEQIRGLTLTAASDVYALTAVLYQCLTGEVPYPRETDAGIMHAHLTEPPPTLPASVGANSDFHTVFARGMAKDSGARYGHAGDLINAAALSVGRLPSKARRSIPAFPPSSEGHPPSRSFQGATADPIADALAWDAGPNEPRLSEARAGLGETEAVEREVLAKVRRGASFTAEDRRLPPPEQIDDLVVPPGRRWAIPAAIAAAIALAVALAVLLLGGSSAGHKQVVLRSGHLVLALPPGWHRSASAVSQLALIAPILISGSRTQVDAGAIATPPGPAGAVPESLLARYGKPIRSQLVHLPLGLARDYTWNQAGSHAFSLVVIATGRGELALACREEAPTPLAAASKACVSLAGRARVIDATVEYPGADPSLAKQLSSHLSARRRSVSASELRSPHLSTRARAMAHIAAADTSAAQALRNLHTTARYGSSVAALAGAMRHESAALADLAAAARRSSHARYESQRKAFRASADAVEAAVRRLNTLGFALTRAGAIHLASLPRLPRPSASKRPVASPSVVTPNTTSHVPVAPAAPAPHYTPPPAHPAPKSQGKSSPQTVVSAPS